MEGCIPPFKKSSTKQRKVRNFYAEDSSGLRVRSQPSLQGEQIGVVPVGGSITFDDVVSFNLGLILFSSIISNSINLYFNIQVINGDGLWLQLSEESVVMYCEEPINGTEAWCLQYNEHIGKNFLYPNDKILSYWSKLMQDTTEASKPEYLVMFPTHVWCGNDPTSRIHCTIDAGETITIEKMVSINSYRSLKFCSKIYFILLFFQHFSDNFTYAKLDKATIKNLGFFEEPGKEYWIMCSPINILSLTQCSNASEFHT